MCECIHTHNYITNEINGKLNVAKEKISEIENIEIIQNIEKTLKLPNICVIGEMIEYI